MWPLEKSSNGVQGSAACGRQAVVVTDPVLATAVLRSRDLDKLRFQYSFLDPVSALPGPPWLPPVPPTSPGKCTCCAHAAVQVRYPGTLLACWHVDGMPWELQRHAKHAWPIVHAYSSSIKGMLALAASAEVVALTSPVPRASHGCPSVTQFAPPRQFLGGPNMLTGPTDDYWRAVRKAVAPAFSANSMRCVTASGSVPWRLLFKRMWKLSCAWRKQSRKNISGVVLRGLAANCLAWRLLIRNQRAGPETVLEYYVDVDPGHRTP